MKDGISRLGGRLIFLFLSSGQAGKLDIITSVLLRLYIALSLVYVVFLSIN
jgi:preprotein translocase subunit SecG